MKKKLLYIFSIIIFIASIFLISPTKAIYKDAVQGTGTITGASWDVSMSQDGDIDIMNLVPDYAGDSYVINVSSNSEVDVSYSVIVSGLPEGVEVALDEGNYTTPTDQTVTFNAVGTILYTDLTKERQHTLHFRATAGTTLINNQSIHVDVQFQQVL